MAVRPAEDYKGVAAFMGYLSSAGVHQDTGYLPATTAAAELTASQGFYAASPGTEITGAQMSAKPVTANSKGMRLGSFDQVRTIIDEKLAAVWSGSKGAQAALDSAVSRGNELLRRFEAANR